MDIEKIISTLNKRLKTLFTYNVEIKKFKNNFNYLSISNYMCSALTLGEEVKVINLFDNYWLYIHIKISIKQEGKKPIYYLYIIRYQRSARSDIRFYSQSFFFVTTAMF